VGTSAALFAAAAHPERIAGVIVGVRLIDAGHFVWEERPAEYASTILDSVTGKSS
jgi:hypothetical protein